MTVAKKAVVWGLFAAGGTLMALVYPALIVLFLLLASGKVPPGLQYEQIHTFVAGWLGQAVLFSVIFLSVWHAAHRLRVVAHDFGIRKDKLVANVLYLVAAISTLLTAVYLFQISSG